MAKKKEQAPKKKDPPPNGGVQRKEDSTMLPYERAKIERALAVVGRNGRLVLLDDYYTDEELKELLKALELLTAEAVGK